MSIRIYPDFELWDTFKECDKFLDYLINYRRFIFYKIIEQQSERNEAIIRESKLEAKMDILTEITEYYRFLKGEQDEHT